MYMKKCPKCQQEHSKPRDYCSRSCANSRGPRTNEFKQVVGAKLRRLHKCVVCGIEYKRSSPNSRTCSKVCRDIKFNQSMKANHSNHKPIGGLRPHSGRGKCGWFDGMYFASTYELAFYLYMKRITKVERCPFVYEYWWQGKLLKYYPDFLVDGIIIEIKGFHTPQVDAKVSSVKDKPIKVLYRKDLKEIFDWVKENTGLRVEDLYQLYNK